jgi:hypothetical protein
LGWSEGGCSFTKKNTTRPCPSLSHSTQIHTTTTCVPATAAPDLCAHHPWAPRRTDTLTHRPPPARTTDPPATPRPPPTRPRSPATTSAAAPIIHYPGHRLAVRPPCVCPIAHRSAVLPTSPPTSYPPDLAAALSSAPVCHA